MIYTAKHNFAQMSPRKIRPIADLVRGKEVDEAIQILECYPNRGARLIQQVLESARGNAEYQKCPHPGYLKIVDIRIDGGPIARRFRPKARGMASPIKKRSSHISISIE